MRYVVFDGLTHNRRKRRKQREEYEQLPAFVGEGRPKYISKY